MEFTPFIAFRLLCFTGLTATLVAGYYLAKHYERLFGIDSQIPSENSSARAYSKVQVFAIWGHAVLLFTMGTLL